MQGKGRGRGVKEGRGEEREGRKGHRKRKREGEGKGREGNSVPLALILQFDHRIQCCVMASACTALSRLRPVFIYIKITRIMVIGQYNVLRVHPVRGNTLRNSHV